MQWRRKRRVLYVIGSAHHALLIKQYREDGCNGVCSNNEDEADGDRDSASPLNNSSAATSCAPASSQQRMPRTKPSSTSPRGSSYSYRHRSYYQQPCDSSQPLVTTEKKTFNEEYTKITTPRQDVLFKKGYLGRKRPTATSAAETTANVNNSNTNHDYSAPDVANGNFNANATAEQNGEPMENDHTTNSDMMSPSEDDPHYMYPANGYVDQTGGPPPGLYYINGSGYELFDPYSGNVTVVVGPAPHFGGPGGGPPVLAAVPCQPLPLQPLEWFNPAFLPYVTAPCHNGLASARDRRKRYSTDSQNCSPQSSESTEAPGSPQECDMEATQASEPPGPAIYTQAPTYVYPGYMFGPPMYNVNGVTLQGAPTQPPVCDITGSNKRRKKKKRRRRQRGAEDCCSEESSSDEKELEEPVSVTSQESSSQEIESDSKQSTKLNNDSSTSSPKSCCQTLTTTDCAETTTGIPAAPTEQNLQLNKSDYETSELVSTQQASLGEQENISAPSVFKPDVKDTCSDHSNCNFKSVVKEIEEQSIHEFSQQTIQVEKDNSKYLNSVQLIKDQTDSKELDLHSSSCTSSTVNSLQQQELLETSTNYEDVPSIFTTDHPANGGSLEKQNGSNEAQSVLTRIDNNKLNSLESATQGTESGVQCNSGKIINECIIKTEDSVKPLKQKKSGKQANGKHKKNLKGKEDKQRRLKTSVTNCNIDRNLEQGGDKKNVDTKERLNDDKVVIPCTATKHHKSVNSIPLEITTEVATHIETDTPAQEAEDSEFSENYIGDDSNALLNGLDEKFEISAADAKDISVADMDGNENKSTPGVNESISSEVSMQSDGSNQTRKSPREEPPTRPVRKEKRKSFQDQTPSDVPTNFNVTTKPLQLPAISLRPDIPKTEHKSLHEGSISQQLKGTADILESITAALTTEPPLQATLHRDNPGLQKADCTKDPFQSHKSSVVKEGHVNAAASVSSTVGLCSKATEEKLLDLQVDISGQTTAISAECETDLNEEKCHHENLKPYASTSQKECEVINKVKHTSVLKDRRFDEVAQSMAIQDKVQPPVPPPRGKKLRACKHKLTERSQTPGWDLEGDNATDESSGDSSASSTTHESEESVIELLSSTHTSPDDRQKQNSSSDEEEEIIFRAKMTQGKAEVMDIKSIPPDKPNVCTPSISGPSLQDSSQIYGKDELTTSRTPPKLQEEKVFLEYSEIYADQLSKVIISEAVSESSKKRTCLPITEAVKRWLRSQSPEVLSLPLLEDETESEISSEEQESDERTAEATGNQLTGQKNVLCNPLPVPLLEDCHCPLVNSGYKNGTGRRVAFNDCQYFKPQNENIVSYIYDNNRTNISISTEGDKRLINVYDDKGCILSHKDNCVSLPQGQIKVSHDEESVLTRCPKNDSCDINVNSRHASGAETVPSGFNHKNVEMNAVNSMLQNEISLSNAKENTFQNKSQDIDEVATSLSEPAILRTSSVNQMKCRSDKNDSQQKQMKNVNEEENIADNSESNLLREDDECSVTSEETLECEWDLWDSNQAKLPSVLATPKNQTPVEDILAKTPEDNCSHMCDPAMSVAKYYNLGAIQEKFVMPNEDEISTDSSDEEVDALKHFQCELEDDDGLQTATLSSNGTGSLDKKSDGHERNKTYGNPEIYRSHYGKSGPVSNSRVQIQEEADRCRNMYNTTLSQRAQAANLFRRKSSVLVSNLKGEGPFPCGGICCILQ
ncbi:uncharacterized protein LOC110831348 isoform X2 [Zootermopsis nevadensis]|uniref:uncharacterized protein LOC110831348 isoform X2 n=1 Tax=Zootermopsis nevadensis TaxID=136037 RepID=UPI000B8E2E2E|nr:uncharacterized protein LOC110831348 isoform X2 [Zootermopsis nevadensis]